MRSLLSPISQPTFLQKTIFTVEFHRRYLWPEQNFGKIGDGRRREESLRSKKRLLCRQLGNEFSEMTIPDGQGGDQGNERESTHPPLGTTRRLLSKEGPTQGFCDAGAPRSSFSSSIPMLNPRHISNFEPFSLLESPLPFSLLTLLRL